MKDGDAQLTVIPVSRSHRAFRSRGLCFCLNARDATYKEWFVVAFFRVGLDFSVTPVRKLVPNSYHTSNQLL